MRLRLTPQTWSRRVTGPTYCLSLLALFGVSTLSRVVPGCRSMLSLPATSDPLRLAGGYISHRLPTDWRSNRASGSLTQSYLVIGRTLSTICTLRTVSRFTSFLLRQHSGLSVVSRAYSTRRIGSLESATAWSLDSLRQLPLQQTNGSRTALNRNLLGPSQPSSTSMAMPPLRRSSGISLRQTQISRSLSKPANGSAKSSILIRGTTVRLSLRRPCCAGRLHGFATALLPGSPRWTILRLCPSSLKLSKSRATVRSVSFSNF